METMGQVFVACSPPKKYVEIFQGANSDHFQRMDSNYKMMSPKKAQSEEGIKLPTQGHHSEKSFDFVHRE